MKESDCITPLFSRYTRRQSGRHRLVSLCFHTHEPATNPDRTPATTCRAASSCVFDRMPVGGEPAGAVAGRLSLRSVRSRDVGATVAAGRLLYDLRQSEWRRDLRVPGGGVAADRRAAGAAGCGQATEP